VRCPTDWTTPQLWVNDSKLNLHELGACGYAPPEIFLAKRSGEQEVKRA
jgi:hypothetical protein